MIPEEIAKEIVARINSDWPNDKEMQKQCIANEEEAYTKLQRIDLGEANTLKEELINSSKETLKTWTETYIWVILHISSYIKIATIQPDGIPQETIDAWRIQAREKYADFHTKQLEFIESRIKKYASITTTQRQLDPVKNLLIELEEIIGNECHNGNIQNYASWGELESEGRQFRYPVKFYTDEGETKRWTVSPDTPSEELITGYYAFGANELNIYRALFKIVMHLKDKYDLKV